jgi:hypothetical protein
MSHDFSKKQFQTQYGKGQAIENSVIGLLFGALKRMYIYLNPAVNDMKLYFMSGPLFREIEKSKLSGNILKSQ